ncbi:unnamed protein product [Clonostachys solani]|uniref:protein-ribulosamine 3-kinase n=1 Tax=Clonostachys solani TaxID=160281 RepID=A0A9N9W0W0_9HYPO|nr:unnamed protein product [Clonostachys solani]
MDRYTIPRLADPAIIATARLEPDQPAQMYFRKGWSTSDSFELFGNSGEQRVALMVKTGLGPQARAKFKGEDASLRAMNVALEGFAPRSFGWGRMEGDQNEYFIVTELLEVVMGSPPVGLGRRLSRMHSQPTPIPPSFEAPAFGFSVTTFCGEIPQDNTWKASWPQFYVENRLRPICHIISTASGRDPELEQQIERVIKDVVPVLFGRMGHENISRRSRGRFIGRGEPEHSVEDFVLGPACFYGHSEYELGAARVYGFPPVFFEDYHFSTPRSEPIEDWYWRVLLYELYGLIQIPSIGPGYRDSAMSIMRMLLLKFGTPD